MDALPASGTGDVKSKAETEKAIEFSEYRMGESATHRTEDLCRDWGQYRAVGRCSGPIEKIENLSNSSLVLDEEHVSPFIYPQL